jgi:mannose-6-phosphate isomerase-like protein (cupin superfamily)
MSNEPSPAPFTPFAIEAQLLAQGKTITTLVKSDVLTAKFYVLGQGGENNLHAHKNEDAFWMVMNGRARFYTTGDELVGEYGPSEGVMIPRGAPYWFESASEESLVALRVAAVAPGEDTGRIDFTARIGAAERGAPVAAT